MADVRYSKANVAIVLVALLGTISSAPLAVDAAISRSRTLPAVQWTESKYKLTAEPGGAVELLASFRARRAMSDLSISVSRSLAAFVVVTPANIARIEAGASALIKLTARVPLDTLAGRYTGQLFVRKAGVVAKTKLTIVVPSVRYLYMARGEFGSNFFARSFVWGGTYDPQFVATQFEEVYDLAATKDYVFWSRLGKKHDRPRQS